MQIHAVVLKGDKFLFESADISMFFSVYCDIYKIAVVVESNSLRGSLSKERYSRNFHARSCKVTLTRLMQILQGSCK